MERIDWTAALSFATLALAVAAICILDVRCCRR
jgi:hypothetical protein